MRADEFLNETSGLTPGALYARKGRVELFLKKVHDNSPFLTKDGLKFVVDPSEYDELEELFANQANGPIYLLKKGTKDQYIPMGYLAKTPEFGGAGITNPTSTQLGLFDEPEDGVKNAKASKEKYQIKPSHIFSPTEEFTSEGLFTAITKSPVLKRQQIGRNIQKMAEDINQGSLPTFTGVKTDFIPAIRDYAGEYLGVCAFLKGLANFPLQDKFFKHIGLKNVNALGISFPKGANTPLRDSVGVFRNKSNKNEVWISSKGGKGAAPSLTNAFKIPDNLRSNPQYTKELGFIDLANQAKEINGYQQPFIFFNYLYKNSRKSLGGFAKLGQFTDADIETLEYLMKEKTYFNFTQLKNLPKRAYAFFDLLKDKLVGVDKTKNPALFLHYHITHIVINAVNVYGALPNWEEVVREILQNNFIQINARVKSNQMGFDIFWPNRELANGRILLASKNSQNEVSGKLSFYIDPK